MFKLVHYEELTVSKRTAGILLECFLVGKKYWRSRACKYSHMYRRHYFWHRVSSKCAKLVNTLFKLKGKASRIVIHGGTMTFKSSRKETGGNVPKQTVSVPVSSTCSTLENSRYLFHRCVTYFTLILIKKFSV